MATHRDQSKKGRLPAGRESRSTGIECELERICETGEVKGNDPRWDKKRKSAEKRQKFAAMRWNPTASSANSRTNKNKVDVRNGRHEGQSSGRFLKSGLLHRFESTAKGEPQNSPWHRRVEGSNRREEHRVWRVEKVVVKYVRNGDEDKAGTTLKGALQAVE